jgi:DNA gyrase, B subunit
MARKRITEEYNADSIKDYTDKEHTRQRPALVFGRETGDDDNPFSSMKLTALREISDNAVGEVIQGFADTVKIIFYEDDAFNVIDNGRGLPVDIGTTSTGEKVSGIYKTLAMTKSGANLSSDNMKKTTSLNGLGAASTIFMSEYAIVKSYRNNKVYSLDFWDGDPGFFKDPENPSKETFTPLNDKTKLREEKDTRTKAEKKEMPTGTSVKVKLKDDVFPGAYPYSKEDFRERMKGTASLLEGCSIYIEDKKENESYEYKYQNGLEDLLSLSKAQQPIHQPIHLKGSASYEEKAAGKKLEKSVDYEVIFNWTPDYDYYMESYVNTIRTRLGGIHENAFQKALLKTFTEKFKSMRGMLNKRDEDPTFDDFSHGLSVIISVYVEQPEFSGQAKEELSGRQLQKALTDAISNDLDDYINANKNQDDLRKIGDKVITAYRNRLSAREKIEIQRQKNDLQKSTSMPEKLVDCELTHQPLSELIICEGDSAATSIIGARDSQYQAVFPIRGKIINALKESKKKVLSNIEVQNIVKALDCSGLGEDSKVDGARYQMVSIAADADPDGLNICCLIVTLFWVLFPDYIKQGRLFKINTPLFTISIGNKDYYAADDREKDEIIKKYGKDKKVNITRAKGLGELDAEIMSEFGLSRETRILTQITLEDVEDAINMLQTTMGEDVEVRRDWIESNPIEAIEE